MDTSWTRPSLLPPSVPLVDLTAEFVPPPPPVPPVTPALPQSLPMIGEDTTLLPVSALLAPLILFTVLPPTLSSALLAIPRVPPTLALPLSLTAYSTLPAVPSALRARPVTLSTRVFALFSEALTIPVTCYTAQPLPAPLPLLDLPPARLAGPLYCLTSLSSLSPVTHVLPVLITPPPVPPPPPVSLVPPDTF